MRVNFILPGLGDSGGIQVVKKYAELFHKKGIDVVIYSSVIADDLHRYPGILKNKAHQIYCTCKTWKAKKSNTKYYTQWVPIISDRCIREADATIATTWASAYKVAKLNQKCGKKYYFIQDYEVWDNKELGEQSYKLPLHHIVIAKWIDKILTEQLGSTPADIVYNGIDTEFFHPVQKKEDHDEVRCLMLYHTLSKKGVDDGIKAFKRAKSQYPQLSLSMFGMYKKPEIDYLDHYYRDPKREELRNLYQQADMFIFPAREEGWGLTPLEAMACGCPVVGTDVGCMTELGIDGENVLLSGTNDVDGLTANIVKLARDISLRAEISENGLKTVCKLSWEKSAEKFIDILEKDSN